MIKTIAPGCIGHPGRFVDLAEMAARAGFEGYWLSIMEDSKADIGLTKELLAMHALRAEGFDLPLDFRGDEATYREGLERLPAYLDYARAVGAKRTVTWILPFSDELDYKENFEFHRARLSPVAAMLEERDILFGLEFVAPKTLRAGKKYEFLHSLEGALELCAAIGTPNMGLLLDVFHCCLAGQSSADLHKFRGVDQIVLLHINDAVEGVPLDEQQDMVRRLPRAAGVLPIQHFLKAIEDFGYGGPVVVEPFEPALHQMSTKEAFQTVFDSMVEVWPQRK